MTERAVAGNGISATTKHGELTLNEIAEALPGMSEVMASIGRRYANAYFAAHGGNWDLAAYFLREVRSRQRTLSVIRAKYSQQLADFDREALSPILRAVDQRDLEAFDKAFGFGIERANHYHVETGKSYIRWRLPEQPPEYLDLGPGPTAEKE